MSFAQGTTVPVERTRIEIETLLKKNGATGIMVSWDGDLGAGQIICRLQERMIRFQINLPKAADFKLTPTGRHRGPESIREVMAQEERRKWRALLLIIKAKLEMIGSGDSTIEREFLADLMLPDSSTVYEHVAGNISEMYATGKMLSASRMLGSGS